MNGILRHFAALLLAAGDIPSDLFVLARFAL